MVIDGDLVVSEDQARLRAPYLYVGISSFCSNRDASSRAESFGCLSLCGGSFCPTPQISKDVGLPASPDAEFVIVLIALITGQSRT